MNAMMSGDTLQVKKDTQAVVSKPLLQKTVHTVVAKPYMATYYPNLLATAVDKGPYNFTAEALNSILPSNIMKKATAPSKDEAANFRFYEHGGVVVPLERLDANQGLQTGHADTASVQHSASVSDSLAMSVKDSVLLARQAIDSLPAINIPKESFTFSDVDSSLLARFDLPELISSDSYILLESHPELVFGKISSPAQKVSVAKVGLATERDTQNLGFISFGILTIGLIFFVINLKFQYKNVVAVVQGFFSFREARKTYLSRSLNFKRFTYFSTIFYLITFSVFLVLLVQTYAGNTVKNLGALPSYLAAFGLLFLLYLLRIWAWKVLGNVSRNRQLFGELRFNHMVFYAVFALSIFPLQIIASYTVKAASLFFIQLSIYITAIVLILFIVRSLRLFLNHRVSFSFWFLYFCTLEILPVLLALHFAGVVG